MTERTKPRNKSEGFVGVDLGSALLKRLDVQVKDMRSKTGSGNRSALIRMVLIEFLSRVESNETTQK